MLPLHHGHHEAGTTGLEPAASRLTSECSARLSYAPKGKGRTGFAGTAGGKTQPPRDFATALRHAAQRGRKGFEPAAAKVAAAGSKPGSGD